MLAAFIDRDGVINDLIFNPKTGENESPHYLKDLKLIPSAIDGLKMLQKAGFQLFVVSNQPSYAKGKTTLEEIKAIGDEVRKTLEKAGVNVREFFYCYHHPQGIVPEYSGECDCRKPKPYFLVKAAEQFSLDLRKSWMVGDQDTDVQCGQNAGCKTVLLTNPDSAAKRGKSKPTLTAADLKMAAEMIMAAVK